MKLTLNNVRVSIQKRQILHDINCTFPEGKMIGIIGPNGSGKSTLLKTIAQIVPNDVGSIHLNDENIHTLSQKQVAHYISYVPQETAAQIDFTVEQIVQMGRHVHRPLFTRISEQDKQIVQQAMKQANCLHLANHSVLQLSGGQQQLTMIAKALAQNTPILLLDEPIASLDIYYQLHILHMLQQLRADGKTIIIVLHDLNLAARFCDQLLLLHDGNVKKFDTVENVLTPKALMSAYNVQSKVFWNDNTNSLEVISHL